MTICALCGSDLAPDGTRTCDCATRPDALSRLGRAVRDAATLAAHEGTTLAVALRTVARGYRDGRLS